MNDPAEFLDDEEDRPWVDPEPLHTAARNGNPKEVRRLIVEGWDVNASDGGFGRTPLHWAVLGEHVEVVAALITAGAPVNALGRRGYPPLFDVAQTCSLEMARLLVAAGADPMLPVDRGRNAVDQAAERKRFEGPQIYALFVEAARRMGHMVGKPKRRR